MDDAEVLSFETLPEVRTELSTIHGNTVAMNTSSIGGASVSSGEISLDTELNE